jgi:anthranilate synthase component I
VTPDLPGPGQVLPLSRSLACYPDPVKLFERLSDGGRRPHTLMLESADATTKAAERSFLLTRCAVQAKCRGRQVRIRAVSEGGTAILPWLQARLTESGATSVRWDGADVVVDYPPPPSGNVEERLAAPSPTDVLRVLAWGIHPLSRPAPQTLLVAGVFAYDMLAVYEDLPDVPDGPDGAPDFTFWFAEEIIVVDHRQGATRVVVHAIGGDGAEERFHDAVARVAELVPLIEGTPTGAEIPSAAPDQGTAEVDISDEQFAAVVTDLKHRIVAGDVYQIVPSRRYSLPCSDPFATYRRLRDLNPSPYMFYVRGEEMTLLGASPETAIQVLESNRRVYIRPIAGTARRGRADDGTLDADLDGRLEAALRLDEKELAEHMMLIDLARNDVARVSRPGTRHVSRLLGVDRYSHVMHLVSEVTGELREEFDALHAYVASMNMGTLVGAPKLEAATILRGVEATRRGPYGGAVGYIGDDGSMDSAIVIRSAVVRDGVAHVRAGAGVVFDSDPGSEAVETSRKAAAVLRALGGYP